MDPNTSWRQAKSELRRLQNSNDCIRGAQEVALKPIWPGTSAQNKHTTYRRNVPCTWFINIWNTVCFGVFYPMMNDVLWVLIWQIKWQSTVIFWQNHPQALEQVQAVPLSVPHLNEKTRCPNYPKPLFPFHGWSKAFSKIWNILPGLEKPRV